MKHFRVFSPSFSEGYRDVVAESKEEACLWFLAFGLDDADCRIVSLSRGGPRSGAGRPKNSAGTGKWGGQPTKAIRVPEKIANNIETLGQAYESMIALAEYFNEEAEKAKTQSKTGDYPRTWDKALRLLDEINEILRNEPYIV